MPFIQSSASEFIELFVGVGASRVRDIFKQAKAPRSDPRNLVKSIEDGPKRPQNALFLFFQ